MCSESQTKQLGGAAIGALAVLTALCGAAKAADPYGSLNAPVASPSRFEVRLGAFVHDPVSPERGGADINGEILFDPFAARDRSTIWGALAPRLHLGGTASLAGKTSQVYTGFTWTWDIAPKIFVEAGLGLAAHNGKTAIPAPVGFNAMGCGWGFHEQAALGYRITDAVSVMLSVEHTSNSGVCKSNRGLTNVGVRLGYRF